MYAKIKSICSWIPCCQKYFTIFGYVIDGLTQNCNCCKNIERIYMHRLFYSRLIPLIQWKIHTKISIRAMKFLPPSNLVAYFLISIYNVKPFLAFVKLPLNIYISTSMKGLTLWNEFSVCIRMNKWHLTPLFYILE